ncbi:hypothetical protein HYFRA_00007982 [Hymenoscyphus fraxineus]|uniref:FAD-binding FR-type domain-containing protein n=1 Tax=Hymenoscyphus fraxineus TaxID=746836 RepID=A0A9N9KNR1_9HELO|nr:hypothetical protein HYFRA_00007982 [Hymenoscyphus fraxineus]
MELYEEFPFHDGEKTMHKLLQIPMRDNPTQPFLTPYAANTLTRSPILALGALDSKGRHWTSLWGGEAGFSRPVAQGVIGMKTIINQSYDPVAEILLEGRHDGEVVKAEGAGKMVGMLAIDLETRSRVKLYGRMVAGALQGTEEGIGHVQLVVKIEQSLGNCPKYLNKKHILPSIPQPKLVTSELPLPQAALDLVSKSDLFFISSSNQEADMDTNHRGGPAGFVRILQTEKGTSLVYPEYSGNRLYQTLGNLITTPQAGLVFPDFETGDVLYVTGNTEILAGKSAAELISHTNLAVKVNIEAVRFVANGLGFRGEVGEYSPYNPPVRYLSTEATQSTKEIEQIPVQLIDKKIITPTIGRFRFRITDAQKPGLQWKPGQHVALGFKDELDTGYRHMNDDDPKSLNDDYIRTFTVSSRQDSPASSEEFEITIRKVGVVTDFLFKHNIRAGLEVSLQGFGGDFFIEQNANENVSFVAAGVGITPLLAQSKDLDLQRFHLFWTIRADDLALVSDTFDNAPGLEKRTMLFVTGAVDEDSVAWKRLNTSCATLCKGRMAKSDLEDVEVARWYLCTGNSLRNLLVGWLSGKEVVYEDFNY